MKEAEAKLQFEASLLRLRELEDKEREAKELAENNPNTAKATTIAIAPEKGKPPPTLGYILIILQYVLLIELMISEKN